MKFITRKDLQEHTEFYLSEILTGKIFIYPTDTIYGIGCSAIDEFAVNTIREIKKRDTRPFSIIAPSLHWIRLHCQIEPQAEEWLKKLPGPWTFILPLKNLSVVAPSVSGNNTLGVRIPNHWISQVVEKAGVPFVTTSVNITGLDRLRSKDDLSFEIEQQVDYFIDDGVLDGVPSTLVKLTDGEEETIVRK